MNIHSKLFYKIGFVLSIFLFLFILSGNCSRKNISGPSNDALINGGLFNILNNFDLTLLFNNISYNVILKSYTDLEFNAANLKTATDTYAQNCTGSTSVQPLQDLWKLNMTALKDSEITQFGPSVQGGYYESMDPWVNSYTSNPADTTSMETYITGGGPFTQVAISSLNKLQRGLPAIEYLLFDDGTGNSSLSSICTVLTGNRLLFLTALVTDYYNNANNLKNAWSTANGNFVAELPASGRGSTFFETQKAGLDALINQMIALLNSIVDKKLGYPAGLNISSNGVIRSNNVESRYANYSATNLVNNLKSIQKYYAGNGGTGISDYVKSINPILDRKIIAEIDDAILKTQAIGNLKSSLAIPDITASQEAYNAIRTLRTTLTTELSSLSGTGAVGSTGDGD